MSNPSIEEYQEDYKVDKFNLDVECESQTMLYMKYADIAAKAKRDHQLAWERVKTINAEVILNKPGKNMAISEANYRTDDDYMDAKTAMVEAQYELDIATARVIAMSNRKSMIEQLVKLWAGEYYAEPKPKGVDRGKLKEARANRASRKVRTKKRK